MLCLGGVEMDSKQPWLAQSLVISRKANKRWVTYCMLERVLYMTFYFSNLGIIRGNSGI